MKNKLTDEKLVFLIHKGDSYAETVFYAKYYKKSQITGKQYCSIYSSLGITEDEFAAVAFSAVAICVKKFKKIKGTFNSYWTATVKNEVAKYIKENVSISSNKSNVSFDNTYYKDNEIISYHDTLSSNENNSSVTLEECIRKYIYSPISNLTDDEALVAHFLYYREYSYEEIMKRTGWKRDKTFYVIRKTRKKISDYLKSAYFN